MKRIIRLGMIFILLAIMMAVSAPFTTKTYAQQGEIIWSEPVNISNSPDLTSTDAFLLPDPAGGVHLFWAERSSQGPAQNPDTLMYAYWDGATWTKPIDIFFSPDSDGNPTLSYPHAVLDDSGRIHLFWISQPNFPYYSLNYSSVEASKARFASAWKPKTIIADDLTGSKYSIQIAYAPPETLHLIYSGGAMGDRPLEDRTVRYIRSTDGGETWSEPTIIFISPVLLWGTSDTRLIYVPPSNLYASWTLWDTDGNGYRVYFDRSRDNGMTWDEPIILAENRDDEYERDWNNLVYLGENELMAIWEGGWRAYRGAQYSNDGGKTWSDPVDTFPRLIGDNGFVEFARDSAGTWHAFLAQRIREGTVGSSGTDDSVSLWHSTWLGGQGWSDATTAITGDSTKNMTNPKVAIVNGNQIVAAWYGSQIYDIYVATGVIQGAPAVEPKPWVDSEVNPNLTPSQAVPTPDVQSTAQPTPTPLISPSTGPLQNTTPLYVLFGVVSSLIVSIVMMVMVIYRGRQS